MFEAMFANCQTEYIGNHELFASHFIKMLHYTKAMPIELTKIEIDFIEQASGGKMH